MFPLLLLLVVKPAKEIQDGISHLQPVWMLVDVWSLHGSRKPNNGTNISHILWVLNGAASAGTALLQPELLRHRWTHSHPVASTLEIDETIRVRLPHTHAGSWHQRELGSFQAVKSRKLRFRFPGVIPAVALGPLPVLQFPPADQEHAIFLIFLLVMSNECLGC